MHRVYQTSITTVTTHTHAHTHARALSLSRSLALSLCACVRSKPASMCRIIEASQPDPCFSKHLLDYYYYFYFGDQEFGGHCVLDMLSLATDNKVNGALSRQVQLGTEERTRAGRKAKPFGFFLLLSQLKEMLDLPPGGASTLLELRCFF